MMHRTKCDPSHACSVCISAPRERVNAAPTDAKLLFLAGWPPPVAARPPAAPSGVQMLATWLGLGERLGFSLGLGLALGLGMQMLPTIAISEASSAASTCGSRESLFFSRNSSAK